MTHAHEKTRTKEAASTSPGEYLDLTLPYHFSHLARDHNMDLRIGDYVRVRGLSGKYELLDVFPRFGSCRVRAVGETECLLMPWAYVSPWKERRTSALTRAVGNWLLRGSKVYLSSEPDRMLKTLKVNWDSETSDVQAQDGTVFRDVSWDELEFWNPEDYHLAGE